jgi:SAM-dependent methyltransferase
METVTCNLCDSADQQVVYSKPDEHYFTHEWFTVVECLNCGLGFVNPRPTPDEMFRYYPSAYYGYDDLDPDYHRDRYEVEAEVVRARIPDGAGRLLLDIGCANGNFPRQMKKLGWEAEGVEISASSRSISDFKIYREQFPQIPINEPRYDAVTAWAVLEHVHDPMAHFRKAAAILKPGGVFVFLVTNFESVSSRRLFREDVPRHLYFFTEKTIREYLSRHGLVLVATNYGNNIFSMRPVGWLRYYIHQLTGRKLKWQDIPLNRTEYLAKHRLGNKLINNLRYVALHPFTVLDRLLMPFFERWQILSSSYGIVTYVAIKR